MFALVSMLLYVLHGCKLPEFYQRVVDELENTPQRCVADRGEIYTPYGAWVWYKGGVWSASIRHSCKVPWYVRWRLLKAVTYALHNGAKLRQVV